MNKQAFDISRLAQLHAGFMIFYKTGALPTNCQPFEQSLAEYQRLQKLFGVALHNDLFIEVLERDYLRLQERKAEAFAKLMSRQA
jgi:hypothetical protein